jgi:hypothetical protein
MTGEPFHFVDHFPGIQSLFRVRVGDRVRVRVSRYIAIIQG